VASKRSQIIAAWKARLVAIAIGDGFETDAGLSVYVGFVPTLGEQDAELSLALTVGVDTVPNPLLKKGKAFVELLLTVTVLAKTASLDAWQVLEAGLADVKRAIEGPTDKTFGGLVTAEIERVAADGIGRGSGGQALSTSQAWKVSFQETIGNP
jgi:hypothetical protein